MFSIDIWLTKFSDSQFIGLCVADQHLFCLLFKKQISSGSELLYNSSLFGGCKDQITSTQIE